MCQSCCPSPQFQTPHLPPSLPAQHREPVLLLPLCAARGHEGGAAAVRRRLQHGQPRGGCRHAGPHAQVRLSRGAAAQLAAGAGGSSKRMRVGSLGGTDLPHAPGYVHPPSPRHHSPHTSAQQGATVRLLHSSAHSCAPCASLPRRLVHSEELQRACPIPFDEGRLWKGDHSDALRAELQVGRCYHAQQS